MLGAHRFLLKLVSKCFVVDAESDAQSSEIDPSVKGNSVRKEEIFPLAFMKVKWSTYEFDCDLFVGTNVSSMIDVSKGATTEFAG